MFISEFELSEALSISNVSVKRRAEKEMWPCKKNVIRGGYKRLYFFNLLPYDVKARLAEYWNRSRP